MAGVKIETDDEKLADGVELRARFEPLSGAINGISREKAQKAQKLRNCLMAHRRDYTLLLGFSRCRFTGQRRGQGNDGRRIGAWEQAEHFALSQAWQPMIRCGLMTRNWSK